MLHKETFIKTTGSGTLRHSWELGMAYDSLYVHERIAWEFGYGFELIPRTRLTCGLPVSEGDCPSYTEFLWHLRRARAGFVGYKNENIFPDCSLFRDYYVTITEPCGAMYILGFMSN